MKYKIIIKHPAGEHLDQEKNDTIFTSHQLRMIF